MKKRKISAVMMSLAISVTALFSSGCSSKENVDNTADITITSGDVLAEITLKIGEETGKIRFKLFPEIAPEGVENFISLAESGYYNGKTIHRVVKDFMMQGGALRSDGVGGTTASKSDVKRETNERMRAYYGALGYSEDSDGINSQFFIVNNKTPFDIDKAAEKLKSDLEEYSDRLKPEDKTYYEELLEKYNKCDSDVKSKYLSTGGAFSLDGNYTIFGQAVEGFDVIDKIAEIETSSGNTLDDRQGITSKPVVPIIIKKIEIARIPYIEETSATTTQRPVRTIATQTDASPEAVEPTEEQGSAESGSDDISSVEETAESAQ